MPYFIITSPFLFATSIRTSIFILWYDNSHYFANQPIDCSIPLIQYYLRYMWYYTHYIAYIHTLLHSTSWSSPGVFFSTSSHNTMICLSMQSNQTNWRSKDRGIFSMAWHTLHDHLLLLHYCNNIIFLI